MIQPRLFAVLVAGLLSLTFNMKSVSAQEQEPEPEETSRAQAAPGSEPTESVDIDKLRLEAPDSVSSVTRELYDETPIYMMSSEIIFHYGYQMDLKQSAFDLDRAELSLAIQPVPFFGASVTLQEVRSGRFGNGITSNSLILRFKRAFGYATYSNEYVAAQIRAGLVQNTWRESLDGFYPHRTLTKALGDSLHFMDGEDLGVVFSLRGPSFWKYGRDIRLSMGVTNGEGVADTEKNKGKNFSTTFTFIPEIAEIYGSPLELGGIVGFEVGSRGVQNTTQYRVSAALLSAHTYASLGAQFHYMKGYLGDPGVNAMALGGWVNVDPLPDWLGAVASVEYLRPNTKVKGAAETSFAVGLYSDFQSNFRLPFFSGGGRLYFTYERSSHSAAAGPVPGLANASTDSKIMLRLSAKGSFIYIPE